MMNNLAKWTLVGALAVLSACNNQPQQHTGRVAILDISLVSKETGYTQQVTDELSKVQAKFQMELSRLQTRLQENVATRQKDFGLAPTDSQKQELAQLMNTAQQEFKKAQGIATQTMQQEQLRLVMEFRKKLQPIAGNIAQSKGLGVVLQANDATILVIIDHSIDITQEVIEALKKDPITMTKKPEPEPEPEPEAKAETPPATPAEDMTSEEKPASNEIVTGVEMVTEGKDTAEKSDSAQSEKSDQDKK